MNTRFFSLIELLVSISIIAILAAMVIGGLGAISEKSNIADTKSTVLLAADAISKYKEDNGEYPTFFNNIETQETDLDSLSSSEKATLAGYGLVDTVDSWDNPIIVVFPTYYSGFNYASSYLLGGSTSAQTTTFHNLRTFQVLSGGPDEMIDTTADNIGNFSQSK